MDLAQYKQMMQKNFPGSKGYSASDGNVPANVLNLTAITDKVLTTLGARELLGKIRFQWNNRLTSTMGRATYYQQKGYGIIELSVKLFQVATPEERETTVIHELCHIVASWVYEENQGHNENWARMMRRCGLPPKRCHNVDNSAFVKQYHVKCGCPTPIRVGKIVFGKIARKEQLYDCRKCKQRVSA
jgi:SprT protein